MLVENRLVGVVQQLVLDVLDLFADVLEEREALVDDEIDQAVEEEITAALPHAPDVVAQAGAHRLEGVGRARMKADEVVRAEEQADLVGLDRRIGALGQVHHEEDLPLVLVELGALPGVEHVLQGEDVEAEHRAELAQRVGHHAPLDVDPGRGGARQVVTAGLGGRAIGR